MQSFTCCTPGPVRPGNLPFNWIIKPIARKARHWELFIVLFAVILARQSAYGSESITLAWKASTDPAVAGCNIYYGVASRAYTNMISAGTATNVTVSGLVRGVTYYFSATTYTASGIESPFSTEVPYFVPNPAILSFTTVQSNGIPKLAMVTATGGVPIQWALQSTEDLKTWTTIAQGTNLSVNISVAVGNLPRQFFRLLSQ